MVKRVCFLFIVTFFVLFSSYARDVRDEIDLLGRLADIDARCAINADNGGVSIVAYESVSVDIEIIDSNGATVYVNSLDTNSASRLSISTSTLEKGSYTVLVTDTESGAVQAASLRK